MPQPTPRMEQPEMNPDPGGFMNFDTHKSIKLLMLQGFKESQAEAVVNVVSQSRNPDLSKLATRAQLKATETRLENKIAKLDSKIDIVEARLEATIAKGLAKVNKGITSILLAIIGLIAAAFIKLH